ncbi:MAG TPA: hypothetical protein VFM70_12665 [Salinimicrobium sp.]|nr:hypothetical protein [Salinimicrobium sp.]
MQQIFNLKKHVNIALSFFLAAALLGIFLRLFFVISIPANFRYVVHAHSHVALLGWVYLALLSIIYKMYFLNSEKQKRYLYIFWFTFITLIGMLFTFPFTGYALFSIIFSSLFLIASYFMAWFVFKNIPQQFKKTNSYTCIKAALWYLIISSIGPWAIGGVMATLGNTSIWYKLSIYFYLHFQYNAWFILALIGILFFIFEKFQIEIGRKQFKSFFLLLNLGLIFSLFLSALWVENVPVFIYILAGIGGILQFAAFIQFFSILKKAWKRFAVHLSGFIQSIFKILIVFLFIKVGMQLLTAVPFFANLAALYTDFVIGYLHFTFLGLVSISLFVFLDHFKLLKLPKWVFSIYFCGFIISEILIFYKGTAYWLGWSIFDEYFKTLVVISGLMPIAIGILLFLNLKKIPK